MVPNVMKIGLIVSVRRPVSSFIHCHDISTMGSGYAFRTMNKLFVILTYSGTLFIAALIFTVMIVWNIMQCNLILRYQHFGGTSSSTFRLVLRFSVSNLKTDVK
jgi:hypothetical protein